MPVVPSGPLSLPFAEAAALLAASATWQTVCGAENAAEALERIHLHDLPPPDAGAIAGEDEDPEADELLPCAVLLDEDGLTHTRRRIASAEGQLLCEFLLPVDAEQTAAEQMVAFRNTVGAILEEMHALARTAKPGGGGYYWGLTAWSKTVAPQFITEAEPRFGLADALWCAVILEWVE